MSKNKNYFRHFYRAHEDDKLVQFRKTRGVKGIGEYWILIELCAEYTANNSKNYESISCKFHEKIIRDKLGLKQKNLRTFLEHCRNILGMIVEHSDNVIVFSIPKLPKYLGSYTEQVPILKESKVKKSKEKITPVGVSISLVDIWNDNCGQLSKVKGLSDKRNKLCNARLKDNPSADYWSSVIQEVSQNSFCLGHNDRGWKANFDWFIKPETHLKVMEGQYRSKSDEKRMALKEIKNLQKENTSESKSKFIRTNKPSEDKKENNNLEVRI